MRHTDLCARTCAGQRRTLDALELGLCWLVLDESCCPVRERREPPLRKPPPKDQAGKREGHFLNPWVVMMGRPSLVGGWWSWVQYGILACRNPRACDPQYGRWHTRWIRSLGSCQAPGCMVRSRSSCLGLGLLRSKTEERKSKRELEQCVGGAYADEGAQWLPVLQNPKGRVSGGVSRVTSV